MTNEQLRTNHKYLWLLKKKYDIKTTTPKQILIDMNLIKAITKWGTK